jgi:hypothetical protein
MMEYVVAWIVVAAAGLGTLAGIFVLTRAVGSPWLRSLLRCLAAVWLLLPWHIQVVEGKYAPAFIVALFEGIFRAGGDPWPALSALTAASLLVIAVLLVAAVVSRMRGGANRAPDDESAGRSDA